MKNLKEDLWRGTGRIKMTESRGSAGLEKYLQLVANGKLEESKDYLNAHGDVGEEYLGIVNEYIGGDARKEIG